jgi:hypothetical protein
MRNSGALVASKRHKSIYMENVETPAAAFQAAL